MLMKFLFQYHRIAKHCALQEVGRPYAPHGGGDEDAEAAAVMAKAPEGGSDSEKE